MAQGGAAQGGVAQGGAAQVLRGGSYAAAASRRSGRHAPEDDHEGNVEEVHADEQECLAHVDLVVSRDAQQHAQRHDDAQRVTVERQPAQPPAGRSVGCDPHDEADDDGHDKEGGARGVRQHQRVVQLAGVRERHRQPREAVGGAVAECEQRDTRHVRPEAQ